MNEQKRSLTLVVPCLNEEHNIGPTLENCLKSLDAFGIDGEVIAVNDGSTDGTAAAANKIAQKDARVRVIHHDKPSGIGGAFWHGVQEASKAYVVLIPGDNELNPAGILAYTQLTQDVDIVIPFVYNAEIRSRWRRLLSSLYRFIINMSFGMSLNYTNGAVIYNTAVVRQIDLFSKGFFYQTELLVRLIRFGYLYAEVPYFIKERPNGETKALSFKSFSNVAMGYLKLLWFVHLTRKMGHLYTQFHEKSATFRRLKVTSSPALEIQKRSS